MTKTTEWQPPREVDVTCHSRVLKAEELTFSYLYAGRGASQDRGKRGVNRPCWLEETAPSSRREERVPSCWTGHRLIEPLKRFTYSNVKRTEKFWKKNDVSSLIFNWRIKLFTFYF